MSRELPATDDWEQFKGAIHNLYVVENRSLGGDEGVIKLMDSRFGFEKSKSQYETRFKKWGFKKYAKGTAKSDWKIVSYKVDKAKRLGKESQVLRLGIPLTPKILRTQGYINSLELNTFQRAPTPPTPPDFQIIISSPLSEKQRAKVTSSVMAHPAIPEQQPIPTRLANKTTSPEFMIENTTPTTCSPSAASNALLDLAIICEASGYRGQSPDPSHAFSSTPIQNSLLMEDVSESLLTLAQAFFSGDIAMSQTSNATTLFFAGRYRQADENRLRDDELSLKLRYGPDHPDTLYTLIDLGYVLQEQGRYKSAEEVVRRSLDPCRSRKGSYNKKFMLEAMELLGLILDLQGVYFEAEKLRKRIVDANKAIFGLDHPSTLTSINNLASTFWSQGRWIEAESLDVQVLEMRKRVLGLEHPGTLTSMGNLASTFRSQGRWIEAELLDVQVLEMKKKVLGLEHPGTLTTMANLAFTLQSQGHEEESIAFMEHCCRLQEQVLRPSHPDAVSRRSTLEAWKRESGKPISG